MNLQELPGRSAVLRKNRALNLEAHYYLGQNKLDN
jgi:hypothetical protein